MKIHEYALTVLCENSVASSGLIGEHGWAVHVNTGRFSLLFDTGQGLGILANSRELGIDFSSLDTIVLSHGHYDHCSGLADVLGQCGPVTDHAHPDCFNPRFHVRDDEVREIGMRQDRSLLGSLGARWRLNREFAEIGPGIYLTGEVERRTFFEQPDPHLMRRDGAGGFVQDDLSDDQSLVLDTQDGLVVLLGCAHAGLINILTHICEQLPGRSFHLVMGGTHLGFCRQEQFEATVQALRQFEVRRFGVAHCTGLANGARFAQLFGERCFFAVAGTRIQSAEPAVG